MDIGKTKDIFQVRDELANLQSLEEIVSKALQIARSKINSQLVSIFLFTKNGFYKRVAISGFDKNKQPISNDWFEEKYKAGEGFTGKVICTADLPSFGEPCFSNDIESEDYVSPENKKRYKEKLGYLKGAVAVPLSGKHRTFGVLEVINKVDAKKNHLLKSNFSHEDILWLSILGINVANAISNLRSRHETDILDHLSRMVSDSFLDDNSLRSIFNYIVRALVNPLTYYCTAILWIFEEKNKLKIFAKAASSNKFCWGDFKDTIELDTTKQPGRAFISKNVCKNGQILNNAENYQLSSLIKRDKYHNFIGVPIYFRDKKIGVLSLYTLFQCDIQDIDEIFLDSLAFNIAILRESATLLKELHGKNEEIRKLNELNISKLRKKGYDLSIEEMLHTHKNTLTKISTDLIESMYRSVGERNRRINATIKSIKNETSVIQKKLDDSVVKVTINLNQLIRSEINLIKKTQGSNKIIFFEDYDASIPQLYIAEDKIQEVISNIIHNSMKAIRIANRKEGVVNIATVILSSKIPKIQISIEDNGCGIRREEIEDIFSEGFTTDNKGGTGMGLFFSKNIIESLGGEIFIESTVGKGSIFFIRIPLQRYSSGN